MARLKNVVSGVVVEVDDDLVEHLGSEWQAEKATSSSRSKKSDS